MNGTCLCHACACIRWVWLASNCVCIALQCCEVHCCPCPCWSGLCNCICIALRCYGVHCCPCPCCSGLCNCICIALRCYGVHCCPCPCCLGLCTQQHICMVPASGSVAVTGVVKGVVLGLLLLLLLPPCVAVNASGSLWVAWRLNMCLLFITAHG
ncbi:hypothetical protein COO60DRAFT_94972 [Scenedesmus sp. NREL 46B-D3]|nr:hypothetical protein COO60DRAFT_94972 [Scenedesmus sp. NREL 46B-D3]